MLEQRLDNLEAENIDLKVKDETLQQRIQNLEAENIDLKDKLEKYVISYVCYNYHIGIFII